MNTPANDSISHFQDLLPRSERKDRDASVRSVEQPGGSGGQVERAQPSIRIGVSACLLGHGVRFDGGHKRNRFIIDKLSHFAELIPVCPEVGAGLGTPRETIRQSVASGSLRVVGSRSGIDHTDALQSFSERAVSNLGGLCGFVLQSRSPTCGMERVRVYDAGGVPKKNGVGVFAAALMSAYPELPLEEDGRLCDPMLRESFLAAVFTRARWLAEISPENSSVGRLVEFHTNHKYLLMAHSPGQYRQLGRLVAKARRANFANTCAEYGHRLMSAVRRPVSVGRHVNTLQHMAGHLERVVSEGTRREMATLIDEYRHGLVPRSVPVAMLRHHARERQLGYLARQTYLMPYPGHLRRA